MMDFAALAFHMDDWSEIERRLRAMQPPIVTYSKPPTAPLAPPRSISFTPPKSSIKVVEQLVGGTTLRLDNGDVIELRIFVDEMVFDAEHGSFKPAYRLVPEVILAGLPGGMQVDTDGETRN